MVEEKSPEHDAYARALALLGRREYSRRELQAKLAARGFSDDVLEPVFERLDQAGYQSNERFAELLARSRIAQGHGPIRILAELRQHGIDESTAQSALDMHEPDWSVLAIALCQRRFRAPAGDRVERDKRANFLLRRGFPVDVARTAAGVDDFD